MLRSPLPLLLAALLLAACDTTNPTPEPTPMRSPGVGTTITYRFRPVSYDTLLVFSDTVIATGITQFGKSNVTQFSNRDEWSQEFLSEFVAYESNGDISYYYRKAGKTTWVTVPLAQKGIRQSPTGWAPDTIWYTFRGDAERTYFGRTFQVSEFERVEGKSITESSADRLNEAYDRSNGLLLRQELIDTNGDDAYVLEVAQVTLK